MSKILLGDLYSVCLFVIKKVSLIINNFLTVSTCIFLLNLDPELFFFENHEIF